MNDKLFDSPVYVKDGSLVVRQIQSIGDALDFLEQWPLDKRSMVFEMTQEALYAAYDARLPMVAAQNAFAGWARSAGILEDVSIAPVWMTGPKFGSGGVPYRKVEGDYHRCLGDGDAGDGGREGTRGEPPPAAPVWLQRRGTGEHPFRHPLRPRQGAGHPP